MLVRDRRRAEALREEREKAAQAYFQAHAGEWDRIRALHVAEADVEAAIAGALGRARSICSSTSAPARGACSSCSASAIGAASAST